MTFAKQMRDVCMANVKQMYDINHANVRQPSQVKMR